MKILLIKPPTNQIQIPGDDLFMNEPLDLEYVAAGVSDTYDTQILDMRLDNSLEEKLVHYRPDIVGLTSYTTQMNTVKKICKQIKTSYPETITVIGGHHATMAPYDFCDKDIDILVMGEGVFTFRDLVNCFEANQDFREIPGISYYQDNGLQFTPPREYPDLDSFPLPDRSLVEKYHEEYFLETSDGKFRPLASLRTSKGCPFRCKFCALWKITNGKYLCRNPHSIIEELKMIKAPYVDFVDDETFISIERMDQLADLILDAGIKKSYSSAVRSDTVVKYPDLFYKWKKAGLTRALIGLESNRPKDLEYFRKRNTTENNEKAISLLRKIGIKIDASFIIPPDYDYEDFDNLAAYAQSLEAEFVMAMPLTPLPGTDLYEEVKDQLTTNNPELFDMSHAILPTKLPLTSFYKELAYLYHRINKSMAGKYGPEHIKKFMKLHTKLRNRILDHQTH